MADFFSLPITSPVALFGVVMLIITAGPLLARRANLPGVVGIILVSALIGMGRTHIALHQGRQALPHLEKARQLSSKIADIHFLLGEAYLLTGQGHQARAAYETTLDLAPRDSEVAVKARQRLGIR